MANISIDPYLLKAAIDALGITAPVYSAICLDNGDVAITTRDGVHIWTPVLDGDKYSRGGEYSRPPYAPPPPRAADDFTVIPQIGVATEDALNALGIFTYEELAKATIELLLTVMTKRALRCVTKWLQDNGYIFHLPVF